MVVLFLLPFGEARHHTPADAGGGRCAGTAAAVPLKFVPLSVTRPWQVTTVPWAKTERLAMSRKHEATGLEHRIEFGFIICGPYRTELKTESPGFRVYFLETRNGGDRPNSP